MALTMHQTLAKIQKTHGDKIGGLGLELPPAVCLPTGVLALDIALGGGLPLNSLSLIYGAESSGKTLLATCAIREWQKRYPDRKVALVEPEGTYDTDWAKSCGAKTEDMYLFRTEHVEQTIDILCDCLDAEDAGLIVLDSVAAAAGQVELEKSAEQSAAPGGNAKAINSLCRKAQSKFVKAQKEGRDVTMIWINQPRHKTGVMFGSPETLPGGMGQIFFASTILRLYGKKRIEASVNAHVPAMLDVTGTVRKYKHKIAMQQFKYEMVLVGHKGLEPGRCNDWPIFKVQAMALGLMSKGEKSGWDLADPGNGAIANYKTQNDLWDEVRASADTMDYYRNAIVEALLP